MLYVEDRFLGKFTSVKKRTFIGYNGLALTISSMVMQALDDFIPGIICGKLKI